MSKQKNTVSSNAEKKEEAPKLPVEVAHRNDTLDCLVVVKGNLTYLGMKDKQTPSVTNWRITYNPKKLIDKVDAITADTALDAPAKKKKILEAYKSFTSPVPKLPFETKLEVVNISSEPVAPVESPKPA